MKVGGQLLDVDRDARAAALLAERVAVAHVDGDLAPQVRQVEGGLPVAAVGRAEQREERLVLVDGEGLAVAQRPALRGKVKADDLDLTQEWFGHGSLLTLRVLRESVVKMLYEVVTSRHTAGRGLDSKSWEDLTLITNRSAGSN